jgi:hypothetical protein
MIVSALNNVRQFLTPICIYSVSGFIDSKALFLVLCTFKFTSIHLVGVVSDINGILHKKDNLLSGNVGISTYEGKNMQFYSNSIIPT